MRKTLLIIFALIGLNVQAQQKLPSEFVGNWIENKTNDWTYGFFEGFAIYQNDFWEYQSSSQKGQSQRIVLENNGKTVQLRLKQGKDGNLTIQQGTDKSKIYSKLAKGYPVYPKKDTTGFKFSSINPDSVTIRGYLRNFNNIPEETRNRDNYISPVFKVSYRNYIQNDGLEFFADIDSLGRFTLKFPLRAAKQIFADWGRLSRYMVLGPGDEIFLYADLLDFIPDGKTRYWDFMAEPRRLAFMGDNARLNNELSSHFISGNHYHFSAHSKVNKKLGDLQFLTKGDSITKLYHRAIDEHFTSYPTLSKKFKYIQKKYAEYQFAFSLMQRYFQLDRREGERFEDAYLHFVENRFPLNDELAADVTLFREAGTFVRDYAGYQSYLNAASNSVRVTSEESFIEALKTEEDIENIKKIKLMLEWHKVIHEADGDTLKVKNWHKRHEDSFGKDLTNYVYQLASFRYAGKRLVRRKQMIKLFETAPDIFPNQKLRELYLTKSVFGKLDHSMLPLEEDILVKLKGQLSETTLWDFIQKVNNYYIENQNKEISYQASLVSTEHLNEATDAEALFSEIMGPHKGKVVYVDFWGTWCGPCMDQMSHVKELKEQFKGKDVVFLYFANRTSDQSWKNALKKF